MASDAVSPAQLMVATATDDYLFGGADTLSNANFRLLDNVGIDARARTSTVLDTRAFIGIDS